MRLVVIQRGKMRDQHVAELRDEYVKRFNRFGSLVVSEVNAERSAWPASSRWRVILDERGEQVSSPRLAELLEKWTMHHGEVAFAVGDAYGHHADTVAGAQAKLSLGLMTLPHQLAHLILIEQLYRAATIIAKLPYHHG